MEQTGHVLADIDAASGRTNLRSLLAMEASFEFLSPKQVKTLSSEPKALEVLKACNQAFIVRQQKIVACWIASLEDKESSASERQTRGSKKIVTDVKKQAEREETDLKEHLANLDAKPWPYTSLEDFMGDLMVQSAATTLAMGDVYLMLDREVGVRLTGKLEDVRLVLEQVTKKIEEKYKNSPPKDGKELDLFVEKTVTALSLPVVGFSQPPGKKLYKQISGNLGNLMHAMYDRLSLEQRVTDGLNPFGRFDRRQQLEVFAESQKTRAQLQNKINDKHLVQD